MKRLSTILACITVPILGGLIVINDTNLPVKVHSESWQEAYYMRQSQSASFNTEGMPGYSPSHSDTFTVDPRATRYSGMPLECFNVTHVSTNGQEISVDLDNIETPHKYDLTYKISSVAGKFTIENLGLTPLRAHTQR